MIPAAGPHTPLLHNNKHLNYKTQVKHHWILVTHRAELASILEKVSVDEFHSLLC